MEKYGEPEILGMFLYLGRLGNSHEILLKLREVLSKTIISLIILFFLYCTQSAIH